MKRKHRKLGTESCLMLAMKVATGEESLSIPLNLQKAVVKKYLFVQTKFIPSQYFYPRSVYSPKF